MSEKKSIEARQGMLAEWYLRALARYQRVLRSARSRTWINAGGHSYYVTGEQLHSALDATYGELHTALAARPNWGATSEGKPEAAAVVGLAQRRFRARLVDEIRRGQRLPEPVDLPGPADLGDKVDLTDDPSEFIGSDVLAHLKAESRFTQEIIVLAGAGFTAPEISARLGIAPAAARQRLSRFGKRLRLAQEAA